MRYLILVLFAMFLMTSNGEAIGLKDLKKAAKKAVKEASENPSPTSSIPSIGGGNGLASMNISWSDNLEQVKSKILASVAVEVIEPCPNNVSLNRAINTADANFKHYWGQFVDYDWNYDPNERTSAGSVRKSRAILQEKLHGTKDISDKFTSLKFREGRRDKGIIAGSFHFANKTGKLIGYTISPADAVSRRGSGCTIPFEEVYDFLEQSYGLPTDSSGPKSFKKFKWKKDGFTVWYASSIPVITWASNTALDDWLLSLEINKESIIEDMKQKKRTITSLE